MTLKHASPRISAKVVPSQDDALAATISEDEEEDKDDEDEALSTGEGHLEVQHDVGINIMRSSIRSVKRNLERAPDRETGTI